MFQGIRRGHLVILVYLLKITTVYGLEYDFETFDIQPHPIEFLRQPDDHFTLPRADVTFICSVTLFNGFPNILWFFNNTIIKAGPHYNIIHNGHSTSTLTVKDVSTEDQGDYHCCISEWKTKVRSRPGRLHVVDGGNMSDYSDENMTTYKVNAVYKSTVILPCDLKPSTKPVWLQNQLVLDSDEVNQTMFIDESGNLVLVNVSEDHSGHYQCQVNEPGTIRNGSSYVLTVHNPTGSLDHGQSKPSSQYLLIIPNHCDKSPHNQTVTLQCPVTGHPSPVISWYLNGELVNLTDYNITDNAENNTWIIQGGDPCRLIGYWQCFATNEAGTVHNEIRVLPYGWINPPGTPTLKVANLSEDLINDDISLIVNITWSPPQYLGGLNANDIYYQLHATDYDINTTDTHSVLFYDDLNLSIYKKALDVSIAVHYNGSTNDTLYIPSNTIVKKRYENLLCDAVEFKPPQIFTQSFGNGTYYTSWSLLPDQWLSIDYLQYSLKGWLLSGNCTKNNIVLDGTIYKDRTYAYDDIVIGNLSEGISCTYEIRPDYDDCDCGMSCQSPFTCANLNVSPTTTAVSPAVTTTITIKSLEISSTVTESFLTTTFAIMESKNISNDPSTTIISPAVTITTMTTKSLEISSTFATMESESISSDPSSVNNMITLTTISTSNGSIAILPTMTSPLTSSNGDTSSVTLFITTVVLISLLIGSIIIFCTVLYIYRLKSTGKYADIRFLKMSQTIKMMKPPLSNNYCSTINIADESVCEIPVNKVKRWIDDNDFKQNGDALRAESFHSIATSQMFAYIRKDDNINNKQGSSELLADYIDDTELDKHLESVCNNTCNEVNKISDSLLSLCVKTHTNPEAHLTRNDSCELNPYCDENPYFDENAVLNNVNPYFDENAVLNDVNPYCDENVFDNLNPYCDEDNAFNNSSHLNHGHPSLPDYMEERSCSKDEKKSQKSVSSISLDSITLSQHCPRIFDQLHILKDNHTNSLPDLSPYVSNPIFAKSFDFLQFSCNETADSIQMVNRNLELNLIDNHGQKQSNESTESHVDSCLSMGLSLDADCELNPGSIEALQSSGYYVSSKNEEVNSKDSTSDLSLCNSSSNQSVNASTSAIQSSGLGYFELPTEETQCMYFSSRMSSKKSSLSEVDFDIDSQLRDIAASSDTNKCHTPNVDSGYVQLPLSTEKVTQKQQDQ